MRYGTICRGWLIGRFMSKFYFHIVSDGALVRDEEGMELSGLLAAQLEALASARDLGLSGPAPEQTAILIVDALGLVVDSVPLYLN